MGEHRLQHEGPSQGPNAFYALRETAKQRKLKERGNIRIYRMAQAGRTMQPGWAKGIMRQLRTMPLFETKWERNIWRRWRQGRLSTEEMKKAIRAKMAKSPATMPHEHTHDDHEHHHHDH